MIRRNTYNFISIICDVCKVRMISSSETVSSDARQSISILNWDHKENKDMCPECIKKEGKKGISK